MKFNLVTIAAPLLALTIGTPLFAQTSGATIYKSKCQMCHLADGSGNKGMNVPAFSSGASMESLVAATKNGVSSGPVKMPAYAGKLTDAEIHEVVAYIKTLKK